MGFFGCEVGSSQEVEIIISDTKLLQLCSTALPPTNSNQNGNTSVTLLIRASSGPELALCTLKYGEVEQWALQHVLHSNDSPVYFSVKSKSTSAIVHITGFWEENDIYAPLPSGNDQMVQVKEDAKQEGKKGGKNANQKNNRNNKRPRETIETKDQENTPLVLLPIPTDEDEQQANTLKKQKKNKNKKEQKQKEETILKSSRTSTTQLTPVKNEKSVDSTPITTQSKSLVIEDEEEEEEKEKSETQIEGLAGVGQHVKSPMVKKLGQGLTAKDLVIGMGRSPKVGETVRILYEGSFPNGVVFDKNESKKRPFKFRIGIGQVIKGLETAVKGMKVGGFREVIIPPHLGYGKKATGPIPANSTLIFKVELIGIDSIRR